MSRRIQTEANEDHKNSKDTINNVMKRITLSSKNPLADNKALLNEVRRSGKPTQDEDIKTNYSNSSIKTSNRIKSILAH